MKVLDRSGWELLKPEKQLAGPGKELKRAGRGIRW